ncbi:unnamed protein product [Pieris brassicae]|uniref:Uncharacterized protein n=1 Tax=Pieris brassicae TaxID=7116 RepID=A0A9P0TVS3_PIEBR|nr:unnamed protein product [Pieris brassicae]
MKWTKIKTEWQPRDGKRNKGKQRKMGSVAEISEGCSEVAGSAGADRGVRLSRYINWSPRRPAFSLTCNLLPLTRLVITHSRFIERQHAIVPNKLRALSLTQCNRALVREYKTGLLS